MFPEFAAVATRRRASAEEAAATFGIPGVYDDPLELIADPSIDVVAVVSPVPSHRALILAALEQGKHVLTEWPVAVGSIEIAEIARAAETAEVHTAVNLQSRRSPAVTTVTALIADGTIGRLLSVNVFSSTAGFGPNVSEAALPLEQPETWMNLLTIQAAHTLDLAVSMFGSLNELHSMLDIQFPDLSVGEDGSRLRRTLPAMCSCRHGSAGVAP